MGTRNLNAPMQRAVELAWESFCAGSLGIGAVITKDGEVVATGRNRLAERDPGPDVLAGTSLAHAELNALAKLPWGSKSDGLELWTTLEPCLQCIGAIRLSPVRKVHVLAPDPLSRGMDRARHLNPFTAREWPDVVMLDVDEWSVLTLLFQMHVLVFWHVDTPEWTNAFPGTADLARALVSSGELLDLAASAASVAEVASALSSRLTPCVPEVHHLASSPLDA